jgi:sporulation protein YlmC with PRC-barrel domain
MADSVYENIRASRVQGTAVYNPVGERLGAIDDLVIGKRDGTVKYAIMSFGGFLGMGEEYYPVPWDMLRYDAGKGGYVADLTKERLTGSPRFNRGDEPNWTDPAFGRRIDDYYGSPPI